MLMKIYHFKKKDGVKGIYQTVYLIKSIVEKHKKNLKIRMLTANIIKPYKKMLNKLKVLYNWLVNHIKYVRDIDGIETLHLPEIILKQGYGDCDDMAIISATMLKSVGYPVRYVITSNRPDKKFNHIYIEVFTRKCWIPFDLTVKKFGNAKKNVTRIKKFI